MPSSSIKFAWAVPVPVVEFGAYLHAYATLVPTIETLRLANRFGQGRRAAVARLPVELIQRIEGYLMERERKQRLQEWEECLRCWEGRCEPIYHVPLHRIRDLKDERDSENSDDGEEDDTTGNSEHISLDDEKKLMDFAQKSDIFRIEYLEDQYFDPEDPGKEEEWVANHEKTVNMWLLLAGSPHASPVRDVLEKHFGMHAWIGHTELRPGLKKYPCMRGTTVGSTIAYLHIPVASTQVNGWSTNYVEIEGEKEQSATEIAVAFSPDIPPVPTPQSLARFARAVKILGLPVDIATPDNTTALTEIREVVKEPVKSREIDDVEDDGGSEDEEEEDEHDNAAEEVKGNDSEQVEDHDADGKASKKYLPVRPSLQALSLFKDLDNGGW